MKPTICQTATLALLLAGSPGWADPDLRLILDRQDSSLEVFANIPAAQLPSVFGLSAKGLAAADGRVSYGAFRETGTYDFGKDMSARVGLSSADGPSELDAMAVMVHPVDLKVPYQTPFDAVLAMAICNVEDPPVPPLVEELQLYSGFVAYPFDGKNGGQITLPLSHAIEVELTTYVDSAFHSTQTLILEPGDAITLPAVSDPSWWSWLKPASHWRG